jgi:hypothetical protein
MIYQAATIFPKAIDYQDTNYLGGEHMNDIRHTFLPYFHPEYYNLTNTIIEKIIRIQNDSIA